LEFFNIIKENKKRNGRNFYFVVGIKKKANIYIISFGRGDEYDSNFRKI
jgi:hypothetical protein